MEVEQRFLFYWVYLLGYALPVDQRVKSAIPVHPHQTNACLALADTAMMATQITMDSLIVQALIEHSLMHFSSPSRGLKEPFYEYSFTDRL